MDGFSGDSAILQEKQQLRQLLRGRRARFVSALPPSVRALAFRVLPTPVLARLPSGATVALYHASGDEVPTTGIANQLFERGYSLALPRVDAETGAMTFAHWTPGEALVPGVFRTVQPDPDSPVVTPDVIIAPMVGFDGALNRIGQGGGHYDRAFAAYPDALRIGLAWSAQRHDRIAIETNDMPLDLVVTEVAMYERQDQP